MCCNNQKMAAAQPFIIIAYVKKTGKYSHQKIAYRFLFFKKTAATITCHFGQ